VTWICNLLIELPTYLYRVVSFCICIYSCVL